MARPARFAFMSTNGLGANFPGMRALRTCARYRPGRLSAPRLSRMSTHASQSTSVHFHYSDVYPHPLPPQHRFPMEKYGMVRDALERDPSISLPSSRVHAVFHRAPLAKHEDLILVHDEDYVDRFRAGQTTDQEQRSIGFPWSTQGVNRALASTGGTIAATIGLLNRLKTASTQQRTNESLFAGQLAGGTHHAYREKGSGFCVFNDIAVSAAVALRDFQQLVKSVLVIDLDTHQGDGTAKIFEQDERVITFSMHGMNNFPPEKMKSDYDVGLRDGMQDTEFLSILRMYIPGLIRRHQPDLIFFQAGVDSMEGDALGRLSLSRVGLSKRNNIVYDACLDANIPCVITMGGGYSRPDIGLSVDAVSGTRAHDGE